MNSEFTIAVHCLVIMAEAPNRLWNSESLSQKVHTHPARVRKIMSTLRKSCLVTTKEGIGGGYRLDCDPSRCSLAMVYQATSCEALKLNWCSGDCEEREGGEEVQQLMNRVFSNAEHLLADYLQQWTIDTLVKQVKRMPDSSKKAGLAISAGGLHSDSIFRNGGE
ncbi:MAG: Rrf2 family transcriptional regulator [Sporolactobacillus sp.]